MATLQTELGEPAVAVFLGNGDGTFQTAKIYPILPTLTSTPSLAPVAIGDLNGDGIPDIATASGSILFGDGKGGFPTRRDYSSNGAGSVVIADFDGDGLDLIFGNGNATFLSGSARARPSATVLFLRSPAKEHSPAYASRAASTPRRTMGLALAGISTVTELRRSDVQLDR